MSDLELKRRKVHGVLSSKSLLECLDRLTVNKATIDLTSNSKKSNQVIKIFFLFFSKKFK